jgi:enamine deaminase RidA (YjgF/YER057c/UK114 family)
VGKIDDRIGALGLVLPPALRPPAGVTLPFAPVRVLPGRALISGHGPQDAHGWVSGPFGKVGVDVTADEAYAAARLTALAVLGSLRRTLGDLDRIRGWGRVFGMVNSGPGFVALPAVINGFSDVILDVFGPTVGAHARSAIGVAELPFGIPVEVEAEVLIA